MPNSPSFKPASIYQMAYLKDLFTSRSHILAAQELRTIALVTYKKGVFSSELASDVISRLLTINPIEKDSNI